MLDCQNDYICFLLGAAALVKVPRGSHVHLDWCGLKLLIYEEDHCIGKYRSFILFTVVYIPKASMSLAFWSQRKFIKSWYMTFKRVTITRTWILNEWQPTQSSLQRLPCLFTATSLFQLNLVEPFSFFRLFPLGAHHCSDHQKHLGIVVPVYLTVGDGEPEKFGLFGLLLCHRHAVTIRYRFTALVALKLID